MSRRKFDAIRAEIEREHYRGRLRRPEMQKEAYVAPAGRVDLGALQSHHQAQSALRPLFGKSAPKPPAIGHHPDFEHLKLPGARPERCAITTLFMDIEGSTKLGLMLEPEDVADIKDSVICTALDTIRSLDGHPHRIMGDAVMAFFGGKRADAENASIDALNAAAALRHIHRQTIAQRLTELGMDTLIDPVGIRIGVDHGPRDEVVWRQFGYPRMEEVSATSFHVDAAAKLQQAAPKNGVMIGDSLRELLALTEEEAVSVPTVQRDREPVDDPYLRPNYAGRDGKRTNYRQWVLRADDYLECTEFAIADPDAFQTAANSQAEFIQVDAYLCSGKDDEASFEPYKPMQGMIPKGRWIRFEVRAAAAAFEQLNVIFQVENHGQEAYAAGQARRKPSAPYPLGGPYGPQVVRHWEHTEYRGLHHLNIELRRPNHTTLARRRLGIWIR